MAVKRQNGHGGSTYYRKTANKEAYQMQSNQRAATIRRLRHRMRTMPYARDTLTARAFYSNCLLDVQTALSV